MKTAPSSGDGLCIGSWQASASQWRRCNHRRVPRESRHRLKDSGHLPTAWSMNTKPPTARPRAGARPQEGFWLRPGSHRCTHHSFFAGGVEGILAEKSN
jgi:hypothetical protein